MFVSTTKRLFGITAGADQVTMAGDTAQMDQDQRYMESEEHPDGIPIWKCESPSPAPEHPGNFIREHGF